MVINLWIVYFYQFVIVFFSETCTIRVCWGPTALVIIILIIPYYVLLTTRWRFELANASLNLNNYLSLFAVIQPLKFYIKGEQKIHKLKLP